MRNGQNKRMRGRNRNNNNNNRSHNPLTKVFESNGPDVKIRGNASHIAEKYIQLARDAQSSGDPVAAENYYQHAEHYFRLIAAAQEQFRQSPQFNQQNQQGGNDAITGNDTRDGSEAAFDDEDGDEMGQPVSDQPQFGTRDPQPYLPRDAQFNDDRQYQQQPRQNNNGNHQNGGNEGDLNGLPSFITGGGQPQPGQQGGQGGQGGSYDNGERNNGNERYNFRRRRHRRGGGGPRGDNQGAPGTAQESGDDAQ
jgi:hypothetical protein